MKLVFGTALALLSATAAATATVRVPAWQEPGFVMEELVVMADRIGSPAGLEDLKPELVIEEITPEVRLDLREAGAAARSAAHLEALVEIHRLHMNMSRM